MRTKKLFILIALLILLVANSKAQEYDEARLDSIIDEILGNDKDLYDLLDGSVKFHFLYINSNFNNKTMFAGREIGENLYNLSGQVFYFISNGIYFGASGSWYSQFDPGYRMTALTAGFSDELKSSDLRYRFSYARFIYAINDFDPLYSNSLNAGSTYKYKSLGARADFSLIFGKEYSSQASVDMFYKILLVKLGGYDKIRFEPEISFYFGTEEVETDVGIGDRSDPFYIPLYEQNEEFGLMNTQIEFPLTISYKDFMFEVSYSYNFPRSLDAFYEYPNTHFFGLSLGYIFSLN